MNITHEKIEVTRVKLNKPFSDFYVQIEPTNREWEGKPYYELHLRADGESFAYHFVSIPSDNIENVINEAALYGPDMISEWIKGRQKYRCGRDCCDCCCCDCDENE